jgi:hypothetical protein
MKNGKIASIQDVHHQLTVANRLLILAMIRSGVKQRHVAAAIGVSESAISEMFPKGLLKSVVTTA